MTIRWSPRLAPSLAALGLIVTLTTAGTPARAQITDDALLDTLQVTAFRYFWNEANPANGLIKDRSTAGSKCSIAANGFGLSAICIGVDHGWVSRADARARVLTTLLTFWNGPQGSGVGGYMGYKGWFYHFLEMDTGLRAWSSELSSIDTALLLGGVLDAKQFFDQDDPDEILIRQLADSLYRRVDFKWMMNLGTGIRMGWNPESGFSSFGTWTGYNEAMILYILAIGSPEPTRASPGSAWSTWTYYYNWNIEYGYTYIIFPPLFGHQYSHCWIDFRGIQDQFCRNHGFTYFENSRRATLAQQAYSIANPFNRVGYCDTLWGLTASDVQGGYSARGAPPAQNDDGTIAPTAPGGSIPFAPEICIPTVRNMFNSLPQIWGPYGFKDAFNLGSGWVDTDYLGIDQGPFIMMIENYRTGMPWGRFMRNPDVQNGLARIGFTGVVGVGDGVADRGTLELYPAEPNPFRASTTVRYLLGRAAGVKLAVYDVQGREVARLVDGIQGPGPHSATFDARNLPSGIYHVRLEHDGAVRTAACVRIR
jgi:hypothetical protein